MYSWGEAHLHLLYQYALFDLALTEFEVGFVQERGYMIYVSENVIPIRWHHYEK